MAHFMNSVLEGLAKHPDSILIRPALSRTPPLSWGSVSYTEYAQSLNKAAAYWQRTFRELGASENDVIGIWLTGELWTDLVHLFAISRAGFVPEVFSNLFAVPAGGVIVHDLLEDNKAKALVYDPRYATMVEQMNLTLPAFELIDPTTLIVGPNSPGPLPVVQELDVAVIFHTSGTTGGKPKPIPQTHRWIRALATVHWPGIWQGDYDNGPDVFNNLGSLAHAGSAMSIPTMVPYGACLVLTSRLDMSMEEFLSAVHDCGMNRLLQYGGWLSKLVRIARESPDTLKELQSLRQVAYAGSVMNPADEAWALANKIPITSLYASTECAPCLVSNLGSGDTYLRLIPGAQCKMIPVEMDSESQGDTIRQLYELFAPRSAPNCPHISVCNREDGFAPGDLFEEVGPGAYAFRGRRDDWIRCTAPGFCDAKGQEDNVMKTCSDVVNGCVVVGNNRPYPILIVELHPGSMSLEAASEDSKKLKEEILRRIKPYNDRLFSFERIVDPLAVVVMSPGSLPRNTEKNNVKRKATEEAYAGLLDDLYASTKL
ncbi:hypothetical protein CERSUDRAFT_96607 [Gelatoporia subvermispora B]|uniref:AMP-dependent synthetase/ligase domain-containing protein n=1 Tax=Ceriporiopsis subvermispora (strain B) TaxID=914234 RepID=M2R9Q6_CERS8|nr:hypothetical protein CERSUDRAFT_96607 [Gelatoporia subvermispora B]